MVNCKEKEHFAIHIMDLNIQDNGNRVSLMVKVSRNILMEVNIEVDFMMV